MTEFHAESFFDFFTRPEQHHSTAPYSNRLGASTDETTDNEAKKYQSLFSDAFGHHVQFNLDTPANISIQLNDSRRFVTADSLTSYFLDHLYQPPKILETPNTKPRPRDQVSFGNFMRSVSDTPITRPNSHGDAIGSNRVSYIVGEVGSGKTLLLCKLARELMREQRAKASEKEQELVVPVYFDFEKEMRGDGGRLLDVDDKFYGKLCDAILKYLEFFSIFRLRKSRPRKFGQLDK